MPFVDRPSTTLGTQYRAPAPVESDTNLLGAAFREESPVVAAWELMSRPQFPPREGFDLSEARKADPELFDEAPQKFAGVRSQEEFDFIAARIRQGRKDRERLAQSPLTGMAAAMLAGTLSPTVLIPVAGAAGSGARVASIMAAAVGGAAIDETLLRLAQPHRTAADTAASLAGTAVLSAILGKAGQYVSRKGLERAAAQIGRNPDEGAQVLTHEELNALVRTSEGGPAGAQVTRAPLEFSAPEGLTAAGRALGWGAPPLRPQLRAQRSEYPLLVGAQVAQQVSLAGLRAEGRKVAGSTMLTPIAREGTLEARARARQDKFFADVTEALQDEWGAHLKATGASGPGAFIRNTPIGRFLPAGGKGQMTWEEWNGAVYDAMNLEDAHPEPTVAAAAKRIRELAKPVVEELQALGIYKDMLTTSDLKGSLSYIMRIYDHQKLKSNVHDFARKFAEHHNKRLNELFAEKRAKLEAKIAGLEEERRILPMGQEEAEAELNVTAARIEAMSQGQQAAALADYARVKRRSDNIDRARRLLRNEWRRRGTDPEKLRRLQTQIDKLSTASKDLKEELARLKKEDPGIQKLMDAKKAEGKRLSLLRKTRFKLVQRQAKLMDQADELYHKQADALMRLVERVGAVNAKLDNLSDAAMDAELQKIANEYLRLQDLMAKGEAQADKLIEAFPELVEAPDELVRRVQRYREAIFAGLPMERGPKGELMLRIAPDFEGGAGYADATAWAEVLKTQVLERLDEFLARPEPWENVSQRAMRVQTLEAERARLVREGAPEGQVNRVEELLAQVRNSPEIGTIRVENRKGWIDRDTPITLGMRKAAQEFRAEVEKLKWAEPGALAKAEDKFDRLMAQQTTRAVKAQEKLDALRAGDTLDREAVRAAVDEMRAGLMDTAMRQMARRAAREDKLRARAAKIGLEDLSKIDERLDAIPAQIDGMREAFDSVVRRAGGEVLEDGTYDFRPGLFEDATAFVNDIMTDNVRSGALVVAEKRGPEKARMMDLPYDEFKEFFVRDANRAWKAFARTVLPDIEIAKRFGDPSLGRYLDRKAEDGSIVRGAMGQELDLRLQQIEQDLDANGNPRATPLTKEEKEAKVKQLMEDYHGNLEDVDTMLARLKNTDGMPQDPMGIAYRTARGVMNANVVTLLGNAAIASASDLSRPVMRYGLRNTFREGWQGLIEDWKRSSEIAALAGRGKEALLSSRLQAWADVVEANQQYTKLEGFIEAAATTFGKVSLLDYWNSFGQMIAGRLANSRFMHAVERVMAGTGPLPEGEAARVLSDAGFDHLMVQRLWQGLEQGGFQRLKSGTLDPNADVWPPDIRDAYSAYLLREIDDTIVRPGQERFAWMSATMPARMMMQFRSFGVAMNTKGIAAGLQQKDLAVLNGVMGMLAMGAASYYFWALQFGPESKQYKEMMDAGWEKWADEAIYRSGVLASLEEVRALLSDFDVTHGLVNFSSSGAERLRGRDFRETILGVSMSQAMQLQTLLGGIDDPTQSTVHALRKLTFYQNVFYLRWLFTQVEETVADIGDLPERRQ